MPYITPRKKASPGFPPCSREALDRKPDSKPTYPLLLVTVCRLLRRLQAPVRRRPRSAAAGTSGSSNSTSATTAATATSGARSSNWRRHEHRRRYESRLP